MLATGLQGLRVQTQLRTMGFKEKYKFIAQLPSEEK
jgi:hypothetical protein